MWRQKKIRGQSTVEYLLYISVISIALVAAAYAAFGPTFASGFPELVENTTVVIEQGSETSSNDLR